MDQIMTYPDKGYIVDIWRSEDKYIGIIKHPCGMQIVSVDDMNSKRNTVYWAVKVINALEPANHHCENDLCDNNRYLARFKR